MPAAAAATPTTPQMILGGEDHTVAFHVEIARHGRKLGNRAAARREFFPSDFRMGGNRFQAAPAQATCFRYVGEEALEGGVEEDRLLAPTRALVGFSRLEPAGIGRGTDRAVRGLGADARRIRGRWGIAGGGGRFDEGSAHERKSRGLGAHTRQRTSNGCDGFAIPTNGLQPQYVVYVVFPGIYMLGSESGGRVAMLRGWSLVLLGRSSCCRGIMMFNDRLSRVRARGTLLPICTSMSSFIPRRSPSFRRAIYRGRPVWCSMCCGQPRR